MHGNDCLMHCHACKSNNPDDAKFCIHCGTRIAQLQCQSCGASLTPNQNFCGQCGTPVATHKTSVGELKQITILFTDICGSTELVEGLDPELAAERLQIPKNVMMRAVHEFKGTISQILGDGILAFFGAPVAYEDHAVRACQAALKMQKGIRDLNDEAFRIRVGLHSGDVVLHSEGVDLSRDYVANGETIHIASRMESIAEPGTICMSNATRRLSQGFVEVRSKGPARLKGIREPIEVFELLDRRTETRWNIRASQGLTTFVGREQELELLSQVEQRVRSGGGEIVHIAGEAGMGKSRLLHEFANSSTMDNWSKLYASASPEFENTPYHPISTLLRNWFQISAEDSQASIAERIRERVIGLGDELEFSLPGIYSLLDLPVENEEWEQLDPPERRNIILEGVVQVICKTAQIEQLLVLLEDLHWADDETMSVVDKLTEVAQSAKLLILATYRDEELHRDWSSRSVPASHIQVRPLEGRTRDDVFEILLGPDTELDRLKRYLSERTEGTPLFIEEVIRSLVETGVLQGEPGNLHPTRTIKEIDIPDSVQAVLAARIDRLPHAQKDLLQTAAVVGRSFPIALLPDVADLTESELTRFLSDLEAQNFVYPLRESPNVEYSFSHAFTQSVAYKGMVRSRREQLHRKVVKSIQTRHQDRLDEHHQHLAYHAERGNLWAEAASFLHQAGKKANDLSSYREAVGFLERALTAMEKQPESQRSVRESIDIRLSLRGALGATGDLTRTHTLLREAEELAGPIDDLSRLAAIHTSKTIILSLQGDLDEAVTSGQRACSYAERAGMTDLRIVSSIYLGAAHLFRGEMGQAIESLSRHIDLLRDEWRHARIGTSGTSSVLALCMLSMAHSARGEFEEAERLGEEVRQIAADVGRPYDECWADFYLGIALTEKGEVNRAIACLEEAVERNRSHGSELAFQYPWIADRLGDAYLRAGRLTESISLLEEAERRATDMGLFFVRALANMHLGSARTMQARSDLAGEHFLRAFGIAQEHHCPYIEALTLPELAHLHRTSETPNVSESKRCYQEGRLLAERLELHPLTLRCRSGLGELYADCGQIEDARDEFQSSIELAQTLGDQSEVARFETLLAAL